MSYSISNNYFDINHIINKNAEKQKTELYCIIGFLVYLFIEYVILQIIIKL